MWFTVAFLVFGLIGVGIVAGIISLRRALAHRDTICNFPNTATATPLPNTTEDTGLRANVDSISPKGQRSIHGTLYDSSYITSVDRWKELDSSSELLDISSTACESLSNANTLSIEGDRIYQHRTDSREVQPVVEGEEHLVSEEGQGTGLLKSLVSASNETALMITPKSDAGHVSEQLLPEVELEARYAKIQRHIEMRITKRPSGGRGEYEISESFGSITPRDILNRTIILDLGSGIKISTGVRLLLRDGKRRLRIDEKSGCEMHLHRQLAAALMLPYPARNESGWALDSPVMQSGLYGIGNVAFSSVTVVGKDIACVAAGLVTVVNRMGEDYVDAPNRMAEVKRLWEQRADLPSNLASLVAEHKRLVEVGGPVEQLAEQAVANLQEATAVHCLSQRLPYFSRNHDVLPVLSGLLQPASPSGEIRTSVSEMPAPQLADTANASQINGETSVEVEPATACALEEPMCYEPPVLSDAELKAEIASIHQEFCIEATGLGEADAVSAEQESIVTEDETFDSGEIDTPADRMPPAPRKYRPQSRGSVVTRRGRSQNVTPNVTPAEQRIISAPIDLRLRSRVGGTYVLSFLPRRRDGMPPEVEVMQSGQRVQLSALHEDWYQDVVIPEAGTNLREGIAWYTEGSNLRWSLSGREVFVLGTRDDLSGFVSVPRMVVGARHMVICSERILQQVLNVLRECCESLPAPFGENDGLPAGWIGIGPIIPTAPLPPSRTGDILDALRPDPEIVIALEGGIRLQHNQYLIGYPPQVRVYGNLPDYVQVMIDGNAAEKVNDTFITTGWAAIGEHVVHCGAASRTYIVTAPDDGWESWPAHSFPIDQSFKAAASICGAFVEEKGITALLVPASMPVLLGSQPGQVYVTSVRKDLRLPFSPAFPSFAPVWAVPTNPLKTDKTTARVLLLQAPAPAPQEGAIRHSQPSRQVIQWSAAILDCCRKGLIIEPADDDTMRLWKVYRDLARRLWRLSR